MLSQIRRSSGLLVMGGIALIGGLAVMATLAMRNWLEPQQPPHEQREEIALPAPHMRDEMSVAEALRRRRSHREFAETALSIQELSQLCWAAQGITDPEQGRRTAPSAGAIYPIALYVVNQNGIFEYEPNRNTLSRIVAGDERRTLQVAALDQECVGAAPVCLAITMDVARTASKYGSRAERYCLLEAGHVAQNVLLEATAVGLVGVPVGAFDDRRVAEALHLPRNLRPVYLLPLGHPR